MAKQVLIIDDDKALSKSIGRVLEAEGYECEYVHEGGGAVAEIRKVAPDLIVLDLLLPKKDGRTILADIRKGAGKLDTPVIIVSGVFRGRSTGDEMIKAGAQGFLEKPFSTSDMLAKVVALIGAAEEPEGEEGKVALAETTTAEVLWSEMSAGFSGAIQFQREKYHKILVLEDGKLKRIRSNSAKECLGRRLLATGKIDRDALDTSLKRSKDDGSLQGEVFQELGILTAEQIEEALAEQAREKVLELFCWESGHSWKISGTTNLAHSSPIEDWSARTVILQGVQRMTTAQVNRIAREMTGAIAREEVELSSDELACSRVQECLDALEPSSSFVDLKMEHGRALFGLFLVGALRIGDKTSGTAEPAGAAPLEGKLAELKQDLDRVQGQTYFQVLEVGEDAKKADVRKAFLDAAKTYHPDRYRNESEDVRAMAADIFAVMSSAHDILSDPDSRRDYVSRLERGSTTGQDTSEVVKILRAESLFKDAEALVKTRGYRDAEAKLREAIAMNPKEGEYCALAGWCHFLIHRASGPEVSTAIRDLEQAIRLAPSSASGYLYMAKLRKACEEEAEALKMFRQVLEIDPSHQEATREVRLANMRNKKKSAPGIFGFGRKK